DEIVLAGGMYELTERFGISVAGTREAPIVIRATEGEKPNLHRQGADQNTIDVDDATHVVFRGLEISGGSHGLRLVKASFVTIEDCEIHDTADVALSANSGGSYEGLRILRNHIHHTDGTGEGMYLGCNQDVCRMFDSLIEGNYVHHTNAPTVVQGDGIEIKEGSYNNIVRDNVIHDTNYPCILSYSTVGNGAPNVIERNVLWNCGDHAIQSAADAVIRNNIILGSGANGIAMQQHQSGAPSNLVVVHNTVLHATNDAISARGITGSVVIANNALYAQSGRAISVGGELGQLTLAGNYGVGAFDGASGEFDGSGDLARDFVAASFSGALPNDVFPAPGSGLIGAGSLAHLVMDDFNGTQREGVADVGAYAFDPSGNPGWPLGAEPKGERPVAGAGGSAGAVAGAGGGPSSGGTRASGGGGGTRASGGGGGTRASGGGGEPGGRGSVGGPMPSGDEGGCACRVEGGGRAASVSWLAGLMLVGLTVERRRRSSRAPRFGARAAMRQY
ncbi:MAG TPA: right-handed parallel beta-helix repeat-containing protein, partial [Polyangiaceae bacterium]|nr:right-handed parallel beta-helix repeat-containing protein [Polyangiaceae bacterium]